MDTWQHRSEPERQAAITELFAHPWPPAHDYIDFVKAPAGWGVYASTGQRFQFSIFGRDSIETAEDLLATHPKLVHDIILTLCRLQGVKTDDVSEEEPGKIHHEHRNTHFDGFVIPESSQQILRELQNVWGGQGTETMTYYGSHDATPLFVRLVGMYVSAHSDAVLDEKLTDKSGGEVTVRACVLAALEWLVDKISAHPLSLFAYQRRTPHGIENQDWKDSHTSHLHADGSLPNFNAGVASIEMQGFAYDALLAGIELKLGSDEQRQTWRKLAKLLQDQTIERLWHENLQYFAQGLDFDEHGHPRALATITSDPAAMLDSRLVHDLPDDLATHFVEAIARMVYSPELITTIGVRCRAVRHWDLLDFIDYHGPNTIWPKETYDIAKGFRRAGLHHLAADLELRLTRSLEHAGEFYEFFYVSRDGTVWYNREKALQHFGAESPGRELPSPEPGQAWTIAAAIRIAYERAKHHEQPPSEPTDFEQSILGLHSNPN